MNRTARALSLCITLAALTSGCGQATVPDKGDRSDPMIAAALGDPLMSDPDLASQNRAGVALTGGGVPSALIPSEVSGDDARTAALADVSALLGSAPQPAPGPTGTDGAVAGETAMLSWRKAFGRSACAERVGWTASWAAQMPQALPVYPRGHVQEAAGNDQAGCAVRAINFHSAATAGDVIDFYHASARKAGFALTHRAAGDAHSLSGKRGSAGFTVFVRPGPDGTSAVDLVINGA